MYNETFKIIVVLVLTVLAGRVSAQHLETKTVAGAPSVAGVADFDFKKWRHKTPFHSDTIRFQEKLMVDKQPVQQLPPAYKLLPSQLSPPAHGYPLTGISIRQDLYVSNFGFFCRKELQVEKATRLPLRFRLGSLAQCNQLEQKY